MPETFYRLLTLSLSGTQVVCGLVGVNIDDFFEFNHAANTRGHAYKLFKSRSVNNIGKKIC